MTFIGIISEHKSFEKIEKYFLDKKLGVNLIHINKNSIQNMKNIKFETLIIDCSLKDFDRERLIIEYLCNNSKYVVINTDINNLNTLVNQLQEKIISYGLNQKSNITVSSITDTGILIYMQKNIVNIKNKTYEIGEQLIKLKEETSFKIYEILIIFIISSVYYYPIINEM